MQTVRTVCWRTEVVLAFSLRSANSCKPTHTLWSHPPQGTCHCKKSRHHVYDSWDSRMSIFFVIPNKHPEAHKRKRKRLKEKKFFHLKAHNFQKHLLNVSQLIKRSHLWMKMLMSNLALDQHSQNSELFFKPVVHTWLIRTSHLCGMHFSSLL